MRILLVTFHDPFETLTGVATYVRDLSMTLADKGHEIAHLFIGSPSWRITSHLQWRVRDGISIAAIMGSSIFVHPSLDHPMRDITFPAVERLLEKAMTRIGPDIIHLHDLMGIPAAFVRTARARDFPVVVTLHDFWPFCHQVVLIRPGLVPCDGSDGGRNCARYCSTQNRGSRRLLEQLEARAPLPVARTAVHFTRHIYHALRGTSQFLVPSACHEEHSPPSHIVQTFHARESLMREALLQANLLLTVSAFAKSKFVQHDYPEQRLKVLPIVTRSVERVRWRLREFSGYPVRIGFLGRVTPYKGAHLVAKAASMIPAGQAVFSFYGAVEDEDQRFLQAMAGATKLRFFGRYAQEDLATILDEIDVLIFPSVAQETQGLVGLEAQAARIPIIGADCGAITDYVRHERNGLIFSAGNAAALRTQILRLVREPNLIAQLSANIVPPKKMDEHVAELLGIYEEARRGPMAAAMR